MGGVSGGAMRAAGMGAVGAVKAAAATATATTGTVATAVTPAVTLATATALPAVCGRSRRRRWLRVSGTDMSWTGPWYVHTNRFTYRCGHTDIETDSYRCRYTDVHTETEIETEIQSHTCARCG